MASTLLFEDFRILKQIIDVAEQTAETTVTSYASGLTFLFRVWWEGRFQGCADLSIILRCYDSVLRENGLTPEEDTRHYCWLLKMSLDPEPNWRKKLMKQKHRFLTSVMNLQICTRSFGYADLQKEILLVEYKTLHCHLNQSELRTDE